MIQEIAIDAIMFFGKLIVSSMCLSVFLSVLYFFYDAWKAFK